MIYKILHEKNILLPLNGGSTNNLEKLSKVDFDALLHELMENSESESNSSSGYDYSSESAEEIKPFVVNMAIEREQSTPSVSEQVLQLPIKRAQSALDKPKVVADYVQSFGDTHTEINQKIKEIISETLKIDVIANVIPVPSDGSCGISSIIRLLSGTIPSLGETLTVRRESMLDTLDTSSVLEINCHGENIEDYELMEIVNERANMNLVILTHLGIRLSSEWLDDRPIVFLIGDTKHYNSVQLNRHPFITTESQIYQKIISANKVDLDENIKLILPQ